MKTLLATLGIYEAKVNFERHIQRLSEIGRSENLPFRQSFIHQQSELQLTYSALNED